jgi:catechol 2,3-dioxygenase-like lactoylglutathione lyase family enzyme
MGKIKGLGYIAIFTNEFAKTYDFYSDKLGFSTQWTDKEKMAM